MKLCINGAINMPPSDLYGRELIKGENNAKDN
jgi:hypothetical protein